MIAGSTSRSQAADEAGRLVGLDEAISLLEAGLGDGVCVDLGGGRVVTADTPRGAQGLLQRLRGHKMLLALSAGSDVSQLRPPACDVTVAPAVRHILDAATRKT